jgi:hypothetical protein
LLSNSTANGPCACAPAGVVGAFASGPAADPDPDAAAEPPPVAEADPAPVAEADPAPVAEAERKPAEPGVEPEPEPVPLAEVGLFDSHPAASTHAINASSDVMPNDTMPPADRDCTT